MTGISRGRRRAAFGIRCHSGWAAVIVLGESEDSVEVLVRQRILLCDPKIESSKQPFHHAEPMAFARAEAFIERCRQSTHALDVKAIEAMMEFSGARGLKVVGGAVLAASGRALPPLKDVLASHALIHSAEGEFYRDAVAHALAHAKVPVGRIRERHALRQASDQTGLSEAAIRARLSVIGKALGPPWTQDQKLATLAAWTVLAV